ncbi:SUMF1/EgtB/PvdO family nonheme iron enzyme, partial [Stieleria sp. ICT_E10.1]|uniref:SUMF1/EgtB/PvdO family nonheme iron enzyme n=1 Tax=Stieleria sedimenti TaxID=2976331 RepID=UPI00217F89F5
AKLELSNVDVDTRSDVYSLGVLLYELLTGTTPFDKELLKNAAQDEVLRIIREQEPPKPSTKISTLGEKATIVSQGRRADVASLGKAVRGDLDWIVMKSLDKDRSRRYESASDLAKDIQRFLSHKPVEARAPSAAYRLQKFVQRNRSKIRIAAAAAILFAVCGAALIKIYKMRAERDLADLVVKAHEDVGTAEQLIQENQLEEAYSLLVAATAVLPQDERLHDLLEGICVPWRLSTTPTNGTVEVRPLGQVHQSWRRVGITNLEFSNPIGLYHWRISKDGYETLEGMAGPDVVEIEREMVRSDKAPSGMVLVPVGADADSTRKVWFDKTEVTNEEFKRFVEAGGYQNESFWEHLAPYVWESEELEFSELMKRLVDATGQCGPASWQNGSFKTGEASFPVSGVSWYEAAAYAQFSSKTLPTNADWLRAACLDQHKYLAEYQVFGAQSPRPVRESGAINGLGLYDMGGNVKEWCLNMTNDGRRIVRGGAWNDHNYMFRQPEAYPNEHREKNIGFRCVKHDIPVPQDELQAVQFGPQVPVALLKGFSQDELANVRRRFDYDRNADLNAKVISIESTASWRHEVVELDAAYGDERFSLHLFYPIEPKTRTSPYQPLLFFPGLGVTGMESIDKSGRWADLAIVVGLVQTGRVVCWPVYKGTLERTDGFRPKLSQHRKLEFVVQQTKDLSRAVDFMQQRPELNMEELAYIGWSRGGGLGSAFVVLEPRIRACVLMSGGLWTSPILELDIRNYAPLVNVPALLMNGRYDRGFEKNRIPLFNAIGSNDKQFIEYESGHLMELEQAIDDIDQWLSARFSPTSGGPKSDAERLQFAMSLASGYFGESRFKLAEEKYRDVLQILNESEGNSIRDVFEAKLKLAVSIQKQERIEEAQGLLEQILAEQKANPETTDEDLEVTNKAIEELRLQADK